MQSPAAPPGSAPRWQGLTPPEVSGWTLYWGRVMMWSPSLSPSCSPRAWTWQAEGKAAHCTPWEDALTGRLRLGGPQVTWVVSCWALIASVATPRSLTLLQPLMLFPDFSLGWLLCCKILFVICPLMFNVVNDSLCLQVTSFGKSPLKLFWVRH